MIYNEKARKILGKQKISCEDDDNILTPMIKDSDSLVILVVNAYYLGVINGKQAERARRVQR